MAAYYLIKGNAVENLIEWNGVNLYDPGPGYALALVSKGLPNGVTLPAILFGGMVNRSLISVRDFGASPFAGAVPNRLAFQAAAAAANASGGGIIRIPGPGIYSVDVSGGTPLELHDNVTVRGDYASSLLVAVGAGNPLINITGQFCILEKLVIKTSSNPISGSLVIYGGSLGLINDVRIEGGFVNLEIRSGFELRSTNLRLAGTNAVPGSKLLWVHRANALARNTSTCMFTNANIQAESSGAYGTAIHLQQSDGIWFTGGHAGFASGAQMLIQPEFVLDVIVGVHLTGFDLDGNGSGTAGLDCEPLPNYAGSMGVFCISGGLIEGTTGPGVLLNDPSLKNASFAGVAIANSGAEAFRINAGAHIAISGCNMPNNNKGAEPIFVSPSAIDVVVTGSTK